MAPQLRPHVLELFCQGVRVRGTAVTHVRVSDMMNEAHTWIDMTALELWPLSAGEGEPPERQEMGRLRKSSIELVTEHTDLAPSHGPADLGFHVNKTPRRVLVLTANYAIRGDLHVTNQANVQTTLDVFKGPFLPLTTVTATPMTPERALGAFARQFVLVNLDWVNLVCDAAETPPIFFAD